MFNKLKNEKWKVIEIAPDYLISDRGRVKSMKNNSGLILSPAPDKDGYLMVNLHTTDEKGNHKSITPRIHRLVAIAFVRNTNKKKYDMVNHLDSDITNNACHNLQWIDRKGNVDHAKKNGLYKKPTGDLNKNTKVSDSDVAIIRKKFQSGTYSKKDLATSYNCSRGWIQQVVTYRKRVK